MTVRFAVVIFPTHVSREIFFPSTCAQRTRVAAIEQYIKWMLSALTSTKTLDLLPKMVVNLISCTHFARSFGWQWETKWRLHVR
jgi:hypothetical protein